METNNYTVINNGVNRSTGEQVSGMIWTHKSIKTQLLTTHMGAKEQLENKTK
jgi:hypothetical protein